MKKLVIEKPSELLVLQEAIRHYNTYPPTINNGSKKDIFHRGQWRAFKTHYKKELDRLDEACTKLLQIIWE